MIVDSATRPYELKSKLNKHRRNEKPHYKKSINARKLWEVYTPLPSAQIKSRNAPSHRAEQIRGDRSDLPRHLIDLQRGVSVPAIYRNHVSDCGVCDIRHIEHGKIHGNRPYQRDQPASEDHATSIRSLANDSIRIARGNYGDARRALCDKSAAITHAFSRADFAQRNNPRAQAQARLQRQFFPNVRGDFGGLKALMISVEGRAGPHHVRPSGWPSANGSAIRHVHNSRRDSHGAQLLQGFGEDFLLPFVLSRSEIFRRSEMRERTTEFQVWTLREFPDECGNVAR